MSILSLLLSYVISNILSLPRTPLCYFLLPSSVIYDILFQLLPRPNSTLLTRAAFANYGLLAGSSAGNGSSVVASSRSCVERAISEYNSILDVDDGVVVS